MPDNIVVIDISRLYAASGSAKLAYLKTYINSAIEMAGNGNNVVITGAGPIWLYLNICHALHGKARSLCYRSPVTGDVPVFNHAPD